MDGIFEYQTIIVVSTTIQPMSPSEAEFCFFGFWKSNRDDVDDDKNDRFQEDCVVCD